MHRIKPMPPVTLEAQQRFLKRVRFAGDNECWEWQGSPRVSGYGSMSVGGRGYLAHRLAYIFLKGIDPGQMNVLHKCDNPGCVNPRHLFLGTQKDNAVDMAHKCRAYGTKLNPSMVRMVRYAALKFGIQGAHLSRILGVSHFTLESAIKGQSWLCVPFDKITNPRPRRHRAYGSGRHNAILTELDVREIRKKYIGGGSRPYLRELAVEYGVSIDTIQSITKRKSWTHV